MIKTFEMFSGYGGCSFALKKANIPFECVGYSEIDKYAIECYNLNHPNVKNWGSCTEINPNDLPDFDLLTGGFPCQTFSIAGSRKGFEDTRGTLFRDIIRIAEVKKPRMMLLENVKGLVNHDNGRSFKVIIREIKRIGYDVRYKVLNSKEHGIPQNRERIWIICSLEPFEQFKDIFPHKEKLDVFIKDILEDNVDNKYFLSKKAIDKIKKNHFSPKIAHTLTGGGHSGGNHSDMDAISIADYRNDEGLRIRKDNCSPCLFATMKGGKEDITKSIIIHSLFPRSGNPNEGGTGHLQKNDGTSYCVDTGNCQAIQLQKTWRRLTPKECFRLMGFLNDEIKLDGLSDTQCYKLAGNGWDINLVSKLLKNIYKQKRKKND